MSLPKDEVELESPPTSIGQRWLILSILTAAVVFYLVTIDRQGFWSDEVRTAGAVGMPFLEMVIERLGNAHPPLFFALSRVPAYLLGSTELSLRLLPVLLGGAAAGLLFLIGRQVAGVNAGLLASAMLLVSPHQIDISQMARGYTLIQCLLLAATLVLVRARGDRWRTSLSFGLPAMLAMWTHFSAIPVVIAQTVAAAATRRWRAALAGSVALLATLPFLLTAHRLTTVESRLGWVEKLGSGRWMEVFASPFLRFDHSAATVVTVSAVVLALGIVGIRQLNRCHVVLAAVWLGPPLLMGIAALAGFPPVFEVGRYCATSWSVGTLLAAIALVGATRLWRPAAVLVGAFLLVVAIGDVRTYLIRGIHWPSRQVARIVAAERQPDEVLVLHALGQHYMTAMRYHYDEPVYRLRPPAPGRPGGVRDREGRPLGPDVVGIWVYTRSETPGLDPAAPVLDRLRRHFSDVHHRPVKRGRLIHMRVRPGRDLGVGEVDG